MGTSPTTESKSPKPSNNTTSRQDSVPNSKADSSAKPDGASNAEPATKPLAPPPRPSQQTQGNNTPDYFAGQVGGSLSLEPNPFEQSFGGGSGPETPGGTKLPSVASLTSPSSLLPGGNTTPFNWGPGSLRTGPLSPAMLSGPANDYFSDTHHLRGGFPTPNESSLRSGLTPGGSGSMFPAPSPNSQALFAQLASGGATPSTLDFHRTAISAAAAKRDQNPPGQQQTLPQQQQQQQQPVTSQPSDMPNGTVTVKTEPKQASGPFDPHDNDAANGLFMLAQGAQSRNGAQAANQFATTGAPSHAHPAPASTKNPNTSPQMSSGKGASRGVSEGTNGSNESEHTKPAPKGKGKKGTGATNGRRKADDTPPKPPPSKKSKGNAGAVNGMSHEESDEEEDDDDEITNEDGTKSKMTDEEKRKNFLERNRVAALKCRQRKKQWLANLQNKVELYSSENDALTGQITQLREEVVNLKTLLLAHKDCPVTQQQGLHGAFMSQVVEPFNAQMNPYGMAGPMSNQQVMAGQGVQRRFS
ncbi:Transcription factor [Conoideocrella luteorostrata]|uniref:Transcription factor n=1 Tax=Conoideocrella luteorostrata TaxID=1105319 RepID=A0AAJ0FQW8_9HYPO|nr:Transcription factor [Conoideocrella luteorostrata]